jgi:RES domain-containing protein
VDRVLGDYPRTPDRGIRVRWGQIRFLSAPLLGAGSWLHGGRFNPPQTFEVLYAALAADTAFAEREGGRDIHDP